MQKCSLVNVIILQKYSLSVAYVMQKCSLVNVIILQKCSLFNAKILFI
jgi:hypothetical protein